MANNRILLNGNLTKDPEYKEFNDRSLVAFRVAVNDKLGEKEDTIYMDVDGWGNHAKYAQSVGLQKGDRVIIEGRLRQRQWEDQNGLARVSYSVVPYALSKVVKPRVEVEEHTF
jgi:single-strand DNA-binding protein